MGRGKERENPLIFASNLFLTDASSKKSCSCAMDMDMRTCLYPSWVLSVVSLPGPSCTQMLCSQYVLTAEGWWQHLPPCGSGPGAPSTRHQHSVECDPLISCQTRAARASASHVPL